MTCGATSGPNPKEEIRLMFWKQLSILGSTMANDREFRPALRRRGGGPTQAPDRPGAADVAGARRRYRLLEEGRQHGKIVLVPDGAEREWPDGD